MLCRNLKEVFYNGNVGSAGSAGGGVRPSGQGGGLVCGWSVGDRGEIENPASDYRPNHCGDGDQCAGGGGEHIRRPEGERGDHHRQHYGQQYSEYPDYSGSGRRHHAACGGAEYRAAGDALSGGNQPAAAVPGVGRRHQLSGRTDTDRSLCRLFDLPAGQSQKPAPGTGAVRTAEPVENPAADRRWTGGHCAGEQRGGGRGLRHCQTAGDERAVYRLDHRGPGDLPAGAVYLRHRRPEGKCGHCCG